ncbi:Hypothetical predicted protein, partial [Paramuricea clavata]
VCANGLVKFQSRNYEVNPRNFGTYGGSGGSACLAPYWSFVNLDYFESGESKVFFRKYEDSNNDFRSVFSEAREYGKTILRKSDYNPLWVTVITWVDLRPKQPGDVTYGGKNTFQLFLANGVNNDAIAVYCYKDIDWSIGVISCSNIKIAATVSSMDRKSTELKYFALVLVEEKTEFAYRFDTITLKKTAN